MLSAETEEYIVSTGRELASKTGAQIVVVTIPSLDGIPLEEYATDLFREWGIGDKDKNNGILLLCAVEDRKFRVEVGYGLEGDLPDGKTGRMQDAYIIPYLSENQFDEGIRNGYSAFLQELSDIYDIRIDGAEVASGEEEQFGLLMLCAVVGILYSILGGKLLWPKKSRAAKTLFGAGEVIQFIIIAVVMQSLATAFWIVGIGLFLAFSKGSPAVRRSVFNPYTGSGSNRGNFGGGFGGGSFGGGGRSGGGGSSRSF